MDLQVSSAVLDRIRRIVDEVRDLHAFIDQQPLQVGDRNYLERSLETIDKESMAVLQYVEQMREDPTKG
jgi:hypothetical protein